MMAEKSSRQTEPARLTRPAGLMQSGPKSIKDTFYSFEATQYGSSKKQFGWKLASDVLLLKEAGFPKVD